MIRLIADSRQLIAGIWRQGITLLGLLAALGDLVTWIGLGAPDCLRADRPSPVLVPDSDRGAVAVTVVDPSDDLVDQAYGRWDARGWQ